MTVQDFRDMVGPYRRPRLTNQETFAYLWIKRHPRLAEACWDELRQSTDNPTPPEIAERFAQLALKKYIRHQKEES